MLKRLLLSLLAIALVSLPIFISPPTAVAIDWDDIIPGEDTVTEQAVDFCKRRQGNQMNLETWYSGKCDPKGSTFSGDQVGFADIFILDIYERVNGEDDGEETLQEQLIGGFTLNQPSINSNTGLLGQSAAMLGLALTTTPASSIEYIAYVRQNLQNKKIVPEAIAADEGYGFNSFTGILPIWKGFRNIAYFFFVLIFMVMGFAIMFRVKINPQTVIGIQAILPKVIALLLIITFSYAIVGLLVDLMYVVFYLIVNAFISFDIIKAGTLCGGMGTGAACMVQAASGQWGLPIAMFIQSFFVQLIAPSAIFSLASGLPQAVGVVIDLLLTITGINLIIRIILGFAIIFTFSKLFLKLLGAYVTIVIQLIFAPIILIGGAFPGSKAVGNWFRNILANLSVFPTTMIFLLLSYVFIIQPIVPGLGLLGVKDLASGTILNPPLLFAFAPSSSTVMTIIGLGLLLMASKYVDMVKDALQVPPFKYGTAISEALEAGYWGNHKWAGTGYKGISKKLDGTKIKMMDHTKKAASFRPPRDPNIIPK